MHKKHDYSELLRNANLKATPKRLALLLHLSHTTAPLTAAQIRRGLGKSADSVTVYRTLEALTAAGITKRVDFHEPEARYELAAGRHHHHHLVCGDCGIVEDVETCQQAALEQTVLKGSKRFAAIEGHALEFFGTCIKCITK